MTVCFTPYIHDQTRDVFLLPPETRDDSERFELSLSNSNGIDILLALGLTPDPASEPYPITRIANLVTAALRRHLGNRSPELVTCTDAPKGRLAIVYCGRREGYIEDRLGKLAQLIQHSRAIGATHFGWS